MGKSTNEKLTIGIRVSKEEKDCFEGLAKARGCTLTDILRSAVKRTYEEIKNPTSAPVVLQNDGRVLDLLGEILAAVKGNDFRENMKSESSAKPDILDLARQTPTYEEEPEIVAEEMPVAVLEEAAKVPVLDGNGCIKLRQVDWEEHNLLVKMGAKKDNRYGHLYVPQGIDPEPFRVFFA